MISLISRPLLLPLLRNATPLTTTVTPLVIKNKSSHCKFITPQQSFLIPSAGHVRAFSTSPTPNQSLPKEELETVCTTTETVVEPSDAAPSLSPAELLHAYKSLSKVRLGALVAATTMAGFVMAPCHPFSLATFAATSVGTCLAIASANTFNQVIEVKTDAQMSRTSNRPLPSGRLSVQHAVAFGLTTGVLGTTILYTGANTYAAALALANIVLYAGVYTPLKRMHPINTWVGGVVGFIPPVIGWVAVTDSFDMGAFALGTALFLWQIPHFMALSWGLRNDYGKAGYKMLANVNPDKLPLITLRYCIYFLPVGALCAYSNMTTWMFALDSLIPDLYMIYYAWKFYKDNSNINSRKLFFATLVFLPVFLGLMIVHKKGTYIRKDKQPTTGEITEKEKTEGNTQLAIANK